MKAVLLSILLAVTSASALTKDECALPQHGKVFETNVVVDGGFLTGQFAIDQMQDLIARYSKGEKVKYYSHSDQVGVVRYFSAEEVLKDETIYDHNPALEMYCATGISYAKLVVSCARNADGTLPVCKTICSMGYKLNSYDCR